MTNILKIFRQKLSESKTIVITTHAFPDADGIGSEVSLCMALSRAGKKVICVNEEPLLERYKYLDPENVVIGSEQWKEEKIDLLIVVDTNSTQRIGKKMNAIVSSAKDVLYIDHHPYHGKMADQHCLDVTAAATGQIVGEIIVDMGIPFDQHLAMPLYTAILIDTNSFRYPTVSPRTHMLIAKLLETGLAPAEAYNGIYGTKKIQHMHLLGEILSTAEANGSGDIAWLALDKNLLEKFQTDIEDTHNFINNLLVLDNILVACMFRESDDEVKISFRSMGDCDVGKLAQVLGGGGHSHSAATILKRDKSISFNQQIQNAVAIMEANISKFVIDL